MSGSESTLSANQPILQEVFSLRMSASAPPDPHVWLARRAADGDPRAFDTLYRETRDHAYRALHSIVGPSPELPDLVQEVYVQLTRSLKRFRGDSRFSTYLHGICGNVALNHLRSRRRHPEDPVADLPERASSSEHDPERHAQVQQAQRFLQAGLDALSPKKRVVFVYHELMGMGPEEIGQALDISTNTVRSRLHHARLEFTARVAKLTGKTGGAHGPA